MPRSLSIPGYAFTWREDPGLSDVPIRRIDGDIWALGADSSRTFAGKFRMLYVGVSSKPGYLSVCDLFDQYGETFFYYEHLYDYHRLRPAARELLPRLPLGSDVLIPDILALLPEHRGRGVGLKMLERLIEAFRAKAGFCAIYPLPLQFAFTDDEDFLDEDALLDAIEENDSESWLLKMGLEHLSPYRPYATARLCRHYGKLGFLSVSGTPLMVKRLLRARKPAGARAVAP